MSNGQYFELRGTPLNFKAGPQFRRLLVYHKILSIAHMFGLQHVWRLANFVVYIVKFWRSFSLNVSFCYLVNNTNSRNVDMHDY